MNNFPYSTIKRIVWVFFIFFLSQAVWPQEINRVDKQNLKQGKWEKYEENNKLVYEGEFKDDVPIGTFLYYDVEGKIRAKTTYSEHATRCETELYGKKGMVMAAGTYINRKKEGVWRYFNAETQTLRSIERYKNGIPDGTWEVYYGDGQTVSEQTEYKQGIQEGKRISFFENGNKKQEMSYKNGEAEGEIKYFHPSGTMRGKGQYHGNKREGAWVYYDESGNITATDNYLDGILIETEENEKK